MTVKMVGIGSQYAWTEHDAAGHYLDGGKTYRLHLPPNIPAKDFWSVVVYDPQTRSMLQTDQRFPSTSSQKEGLDRQPGHLGGRLLRPGAAARQGGQLGTDHPRQGVVGRPAAVRPARAVVRQDLAAGRDRNGRLRQHEQTRIKQTGHILERQNHETALSGSRRED